MQLSFKSAGWIVLSAIASLALSACDQRSANAPTSADRDTRDRTVTAAPDSTTTATDQSESSESIRITAEIRRGVIGADSMSIAAQNCTIVTDEAGAVTLRGDVRSQAERDAIGAIARATAGVSSVDNQLQVTPD